MYHFDIPKTRQYDTGKIEVIARSSAGEAVATTELKVIPRHDDYRGVLKNAPRRKLSTHIGENMMLILHLTVIMEIVYQYGIPKTVPYYTALTYIIIPRTRQKPLYAQQAPSSLFPSSLYPKGVQLNQLLLPALPSDAERGMSFYLLV